MYLTIWRHGEAGYAVTDRQRELTQRGQQEVERGAGQFDSLCSASDIPPVAQIFYSEWHRTRQTMSIISAVLPGACVQTSQALIPGRRPAEVDAMLGELDGVSSGHVLLVSHQPLVSSLVDYYLGDPGRVPPLVPGGLVTLSFEVLASGCGNLVWCIQPPEFEVIS